MTAKEYEVRRYKLEQEVTNVRSKIDDFDASKSPPEELCNHFKTLERLKEDCDDIINELEVDDFLESVDEKFRQEGYIT